MMLMNIFSSFNPINFKLFSFLFLLLMVFIIPMFKGMKYFLMLKNIKNFIYSDFKKMNNMNLSLNIFLSILIFNMMINLSNLLPFSFCLNSQLNYFFFLSLILWLSCILYSLVKHFNNTMTHFTPMGSPIAISPLMVMIEIISLMIRPITLSVRMSANLLAGHLLIHLLTSFSFFLMEIMLINITLSMILMMILNVLEIAVSMIQPYIFSTLMNMYLCENTN